MNDRKNIEQQLAEKLGNLSIAPTVQAWDRIAHNRQQGKAKQKKNRVVLYYYAASVILILLSGGYFLLPGNSDDSEVTTQPQVVKLDAPEKKIEDNATVVTPERVQEPAARTVQTYKDIEPETHFVNPPEEKVKVAGVMDKQIGVNQNIPQVNVATLQPVKMYSKDEAQEQEVNYLLKNALQQVAADKQLSAQTNETALLKEVEGEMDDYYRSKAMKIFSLENKTIRIAVKDKQ